MKVGAQCLHLLLSRENTLRYSIDPFVKEQNSLIKVILPVFDQANSLDKILHVGQTVLKVPFTFQVSKSYLNKN